jgi:predicted metalloprotease
MKWKPGRRSADIEDRRGRGFGGGGGGGGGLGGLPMGGRIGLPAVALVILIAVVSHFLGGGSGAGAGGGLGDILGSLSDPQQGGQGLPPGADPDAKLVDFMSFVLDDVQGFWADTFKASGKTYTDAKLVLFNGSTPSGCGGATAAIGPHYCPADKHVYLDLGFFRELRDRFGAPGDFAQAYVLAHEIGHHVQDLLGIEGRMEQEAAANPERANDLSVRLELQADCFAGVWGFTTYKRNILESGDLEEGLTAAASVGDDRIQKETTGRVNPETWTHGSSEERVRWFKRGFENGDPNDCDTFAATTL